MKQGLMFLMLTIGIFFSGCHVATEPIRGKSRRSREDDRIKQVNYEMNRDLLRLPE